MMVQTLRWDTRSTTEPRFECNRKRTCTRGWANNQAIAQDDRSENEAVTTALILVPMILVGATKRPGSWASRFRSSGIEFQIIQAAAIPAGWETG